MIERFLRLSRNGSRGGLLWIGDRGIRSEYCITHYIRSDHGVEPLIATTMPHARGFDPGGVTHLKRGTDAPNGEDGRDLRLSAADRSATGILCSMIAPRCEGQRDEAPVGPKSLRAKATVRDAADRPERTRSRTRPAAGGSWLEAKAKARQLDRRLPGLGCCRRD